MHDRKIEQGGSDLSCDTETSQRNRATLAGEAN